MITLGEWIHLKTGNKYDVTGLRIDCTNIRNGQLVVEYNDKDGFRYVREMSEFLEKFVLNDGTINFALCNPICCL